MLQYYARFRGDMACVFEFVMCSYAKRDSHRFMDLIDAAIAEGRAKRYKQYTAWAEKVAAKPRPSDPLAPPKAKAKRGSKRGAVLQDEGALVAAIRSRHASAFGSLLSDLEARHCGGAPVAGEPSEEEFLAARQRMEERKAGKGSGGKRPAKKGKA